MAFKPQKYLNDKGEEVTYLNDDGEEIPSSDTFVGPLPDKNTGLQAHHWTGPVQDKLEPIAPRMGDRGRGDQSAVGVNHEMLANMITDAAVRYLPDWAQAPAAYAGVFIGDLGAGLLEAATDPENLVLGKMGAAAKALKSARRATLVNRLDAIAKDTGTYPIGPQKQVLREQPYPLNVVPRNLHPDSLPVLKPIEREAPQVLDRFGVSPKEQPYPLNVVPRRLHPSNEYFESRVPSAIREKVPERGIELNTAGKVPETDKVNQSYPLNVLPEKLQPDYIEPVSTSKLKPIGSVVEPENSGGLFDDLQKKAQEIFDKVKNNEKGAIGDQSGPKNLKELQSQVGKEKEVPVTRVVDKGSGTASNKGPETWFVVGHLDGARAAQINDMYKSGKGDIHRGYLPESLVDLSDNMSDEFGNSIIKVPTNEVTKFRNLDNQGRLKKLLTDETGALTLRGWKRNQVDELRNKILNEFADHLEKDTVPNLNELYETKYKSTLGAEQFKKITNDIIDSGDVSRILAERIANKPVAPMATADLQEAIDAVVNKVKENVVKRNEQDALVRAEKFKRIQNIKALRSQGQQKVFDSLRELKGQYPKVDAGDIAGGINPADVDAIHNLIDLQPSLDIFQKLNAKIAVSKAMGTMRRAGALQPSEIALLEKIFGSEVTDELKQMHSALGFMLPDGNTVGQRLMKAGEISKTMASGGDIGWMFRQGINYAGRKAWFKALAPSVKAYFSPSIAEREMQLIKDSKYFKLAEESGLALSDYKALDANLREETNPSKFFENLERKGKLGKIAATPFTGSNRSMTVGLDKLRMGEFTRKVEAYEKLYQSALKDAGTDAMKIKEAEAFNPQQPWLAERIADEINTATGRGKMPKLLQGSERALNAAMFSPRLLASRLRSINRILNPVSYWKYDRIQRIDALKQLLSIGVVTGSTLVLGKVLGGETNGNITTSDFLKSKMGNLRLEGTGGYVPLIVAAARLATGATTDSDGDMHHLGDFGYRSGTQLAEDALFNNRLSPLGSLITALLNREEFGGRKLNFKSSNPMENTVMRQFVPLLLRDIWDIAKEDPDLLVGLTAGVGSSLGIGAQVYSNQPREKKPKLQLNKLGPISWPSEPSSTEDPEVF